jgi:phosphatidate cytidylyltransferase
MTAEPSDGVAAPPDGPGQLLGGAPPPAAPGAPDHLAVRATPAPTSRRAARLAARNEAVIGSDPPGLVVNSPAGAPGVSGTRGRTPYQAASGGASAPAQASGYASAPPNGPVLDLDALARSAGGYGEPATGGDPRTIGDLTVGQATTPIRRRRPVSLPESFDVPDEPAPAEPEAEQATMPLRTQSRSAKTSALRLRGRSARAGHTGALPVAPPQVSAPPTGAIPFAAAPTARPAPKSPFGPVLPADDGWSPFERPSSPPAPALSGRSFGPVAEADRPESDRAESDRPESDRAEADRPGSSGSGAGPASSGPGGSPSGAEEPLGGSPVEPAVTRTEHLAGTDRPPSRRSRRRGGAEGADRAAPEAVDVRPTSAPKPKPGATEPQRRSRAGRNLPMAILVGVGLAGLVLASLVIRKEAFVGVVSAAAVIAVWELAGALSAKHITVPVIPLAVGSVGMLVSAFVAGEDGLLVSFALTSFGVLLWRIIDGARDAARDVAASVFAAAYVPFLAGFTMLMLAAPDGAHRVIVFILVTVASDIGGYTSGVLFGKHPMAPTVSPHKSWEGFLGSALTCMLAGTLGVLFLLGGVWWAGTAAGAAAVVTATIGDLSESLLKRDLGIKDMGNLLPGHGGMLDRIDSLLITAPAVYVLLSLLVPIPLSS